MKVSLSQIKMTVSPNVGGKVLSRRPLVYIWTVFTILVFFTVGEASLQRLLAARRIDASVSWVQPEKGILQLPTDYSVNSSTSKLILLQHPTMHETFTGEKIVHWDNFTELAPKRLHTKIDGNQGFMQNGLAYVHDVCIRPNGTMVVVGTTRQEILRSLQAAGEVTEREWQDTYNCSWNCKGVQFLDETPDGALWLKGNTTHIFPYLGNVFHHFSERVWPHFTGFQEPDNGTKWVPPVTHYYVDHMHTWLHQAHHNMDRDTLMFQLGILGMLTPEARFLQHEESESRPMCFERLTLTGATCGRMAPNLNFIPGIEIYREAAFKYFGISEPEVALPPRPLRVTLYGRSDASRRRVTNVAEVAQHLQSSVWPLLQVTFVDDLLKKGEFNQSLPQVVSLMAQTDILITPHGANTWATLFMPKHSAVIEVYGPCGPSTWLHTIVEALALKHKTEENPWAEKIPSPRAGNTTDCESALRTPDFSLNITKLAEIVQSLGYPNGPGDRMPLHWLYDRTTQSY